MIPPLFVCSDCVPIPWEGPPTVSTPLGSLGFEAIVDGVSVCDLMPSVLSRTPVGGRLFHWETDLFRADFLLTPLAPSLPKGMQVDGCWAGVWRVKAAADANALEFRCEWEPGYTWTEGGPSSGEWLDAQTWDDGKVQVTVGTQDPEALASRATRGDLLPTRWAKTLGWPALSADEIKVSDPVAYTPQGFRLSLPDLRRGELCQVHFIAAWSPAPPTPEEAQNDSFYVSPWYAVDQTSALVLSGSGCL